MKAIAYTEYGSPDVLKLTEVEKPTPKSNEVLVRVHASSVSIGVIWIRKGAFPGSKIFTFFIRLIFGIKRPKRPILGFEFSGIVEEVGGDVKLFKKGDQVYGTTTGLKNGAYAEYVCIPEKWRMGVIAPMPKELTFDEAAVLPIGGMTAYDLLRRTNIKPSQKVLIYGASGSVGTYAVQLAKSLGGIVTGVCSTSNIELVKSIGAEEVIDYTKTDIGKYEKKFDVVFDAVGKMPAATLKALLHKKGKYISVKSITSEKTEHLTFLNKLVEEGKLRPVIDRKYPLEQMVEAHEYVELGHKKGNVVISVE